jgi:hypothetical protein
MSRENVARLYRAYEAFNRRDIDAFLALSDPEIEFTTLNLQVQGGRFLPRPRRCQELLGNHHLGIPGLHRGSR